MYRSQVTAGDLPEFNRIYVTERNAIKYALQHMQSSSESGELWVSDGLYQSIRCFYREEYEGVITEEVFDADGDVIDTIYHL